MPKYKTQTNDLTEVIESGGAGKLYLHQFTLPIGYNNVCDNVVFNYYSTNNQPLTWSDIESKGWKWLSQLTYKISTISNTAAMVGFPCALWIGSVLESGKFRIKAYLSVMLLASMGTITTKEITLNRIVSDEITEV